MHRFQTTAFGIAAAIAASGCHIPAVEWDTDHCTVAEPAGSSCEASMNGRDGHDAFRIALDPASGGFGAASIELVLTGSGSDIADGEYEIDGGDYDEGANTAPGLAFDASGGSGTVVVESFEFVGTNDPDDFSDGESSFGLGDFDRGTFTVALDLTGFLDAGGRDSVSTLVASGELLPEGGGGNGTIASCTDRVATGACTQFDLTNAGDPTARAADIEASCGNGADGDGKDFSASPCGAAERIASCTGATGTLETTGETVPLEVAWYPEACDLGLTTENLQSTCVNTLGGSFTGGCG